MRRRAELPHQATHAILKRPWGSALSMTARSLVRVVSRVYGQDGTAVGGCGAMFEIDEASVLCYLGKLAGRIALTECGARWTLVDGLRETIAWYRERLAIPIIPSATSSPSS